MFAGLSRVIELGVSVILIEQFVHRALAIADRCYVLRRGRTVWSGEASEAGADLVEHYLGGSNSGPDLAPAGDLTWPRPRSSDCGRGCPRPRGACRSASA